MNKKYNLKLDLQFRCNNSKMIFDEFDENTSDFFMQITRQGQLIDISNAIPTLLVLKPSGVAVTQILNVKDNLIYGNLNNSLKNEVGTYIAKLMLVEGDKKTFISNISYEVTENALLGKIDDDIVEDERYSVLLQLLERLSNIELQEQTRIDNESSRIEAENLREEAIEKIKNDIDFLINETNKKVSDNLNSNTSKIDNLIINTKEELNKYKENKDKFINEDLKEFKENTNKSIDNYKASKDIEIDNTLNTYKTNTTNDINSFKNTINSEIDKYKNDKDKAINKYIEDKNLELDNYVEVKSNELDLYVSEKNALIDFKISEVDNAKTQMQNSVDNKLVEVDNAEQIRQQEHESRQQFLNGFEGKLNTVVDDVATIKDDVVSVREANKRQDIFLQGLYNENLDGRVTVKEEGSVISLTNSDNGLVDIVGLEGNTLVNYCVDGAKELTLNGDIDVEGTNITLAEGVDNGLVDVALEGNTLVNLCTNKWHGNNIDMVASSYRTVKSNTNYTVISLKASENNRFGIYNVAGSIPLLPYGSEIIRTFNTGEHTEIKVYGLNGVDGMTIDFPLDSVMIFEGDLTQTPGLIPTEYFEGMKSVAECEDNKIEIVSQSKNLFNKEKYSYTDNYFIDVDGVAKPLNGYIAMNEYMTIKPNTTYTTSNINCVVEYDVNKNITARRLTWDNKVFTSTENTKYIRLQLGFSDDLEHIQIEEGSVATSYAPHATNKKQITLSEPLRALPNGVKDKIVKIGGKHYVERNCGQIVLNGSENWRSFGSSESTIVFYSKVIDELSKTGINIHCDKFIPSIKSWSASSEIEGIQIDPDISLTIQISKSKLTTTDISGFKQWLSENPTTVIYELQTPTYEELPIDPTVNTYNDTTHISNNSTIPCNMKIKNTGYNAIIKPSTQYTVAFDTNTSGEVGINLAGSKVTTNNNVATVTTPSTLVDDSLRLYGKGIKASKVRLLESDNTNYIPSFFEGMKSSFEDKSQDDGTYKMEILSNNKNFFNKNNAKKTDKWLRGLYDSFKIQLKPNTIYSISVNYKTDKHRWLGLFEEPYNWSKPLWTHTWNNNQSGLLKGQFVSPKDGVCYISIYNESITEENLEYLFDSVYSDLIIQEKKYGYEPFENQSNKIQFSSIEPLRGVGDVKDRFVFKDGKLMIERKCGQATFDGTIGVDNGGYNSAYGIQIIIVYGHPKINNKKTNSQKTINSTLPCITNEAYRLRKQPNFSGYVDESAKFVGAIPNTTGVAFNHTELNQYFVNNPMQVVYELETPTYEEIPFELQKIILEGYKSGTLFFDTNIPPTVEASYTANIPLISKVNEVNDVTETNTEDIAITQMAVDFLLMSTLGEEMLNFKVRSGYNMASYFASRIIKGALKYEDVINKYPRYKEDINLILISEGYSDLIVEL